MPLFPNNATVWIRLKATTRRFSPCWGPVERRSAFAGNKPLSRICMYRRTRLEWGRSLERESRRDAAPSNNSPAKGNISFYYCAPIAHAFIRVECAISERRYHWPVANENRDTTIRCLSESLRIQFCCRNWSRNFWRIIVWLDNNFFFIPFSIVFFILIKCNDFSNLTI